MQNSYEKFAGVAAKLALRESEKFCDLHAASERIRNLRQPHQICGTGQKEAAWALIRVYAALDGEQNFRCALNLIDHRPVETPHETHRIRTGRIEGRLIVQSQKGHLTMGELFRQRSLARLPRPCDQHYARIRESFSHTLFDEPGIHEGSSDHGKWSG